jgi:hypothetical protein
MASVSKVHTKDGRTKYRERYRDLDRTQRARRFERSVDGNALCSAVVTDQMARLPAKAVETFRLTGDM